MPDPLLLRTAVPYFADPAVAVVQFRWGFLNEQFSLLTRLQALLLRTHFVVEQPARARGGYFANFNGSAGVWRRTAIEDAGGWRAHTLTEDLDLSYRAQMRGWRIVYLEHDVCDCELPVDMDGFRSQQFRWMKGGAENARLHAGAIVRSRLPLAVKVHACGHLLASTVYALTLGMLVAAVGLSLSDDQVLREASARIGTPVLLSTAALVVAFREGQRPAQVSPLRFAVTMIAFLTFTLGLSLHNATAAGAGWIGRRTEFVRTPKYGIVGGEGQWTAKTYASARVAPIVWAEAGLLALVAAAVLRGIQQNEFSMFIVEVPSLAGLSWIVGLSLWDVVRVRAAVRDAASQVSVTDRVKEARRAAR